MTEPEDLTLVLLGNLTDDDPWDLELWVRDDDNSEGSHAHWYRTGTSEDGSVRRLSWDRLRDRARESRRTLSVVTPASYALGAR